MSNPSTTTSRRPNLFELEKQIGLLQQHVAVLTHSLMMASVIPPPQAPPQAFVRPVIPQNHRPPSHTVQTAVPLQQAVPLTRTHAPRGRFQTRRYVPNRDVNPVRHAQEDDREISPYLLSDLLQEGEEVTMRIIIGAEQDGYPQFATATLQYDGTRLTVRACESVPSLVGKTSDKAGALLYQFMDGLFDIGQLRRKFSIAPWKLCFVQRDGQLISLNKLRKQSQLASSVSA